MAPGVQDVTVSATKEDVAPHREVKHAGQGPSAPPRLQSTATAGPRPSPLTAITINVNITGHHLLESTKNYPQSDALRGILLLSYLGGPS